MIPSKIRSWRFQIKKYFYKCIISQSIYLIIHDCRKQKSLLSYRAMNVRYYCWGLKNRRDEILSDVVMDSFVLFCSFVTLWKRERVHGFLLRCWKLLINFVINCKMKVYNYNDLLFGHFNRKLLLNVSSPSPRSIQTW